MRAILECVKTIKVNLRKRASEALLRNSSNPKIK
jgi:hypothetical protein